MAERSSFTLPADVEFEVDGDSIDLAFDGDIILEQTLGYTLRSVRATGDLIVRLPLVTGDLRAGGVLHIQGELDAGSLRAAEVVIGEQAVKCQSISATERISIGAAELRVDAIIAPDIDLDPKASGRVTVIESANERGATKIKGGFSLADYDDMFGNADEFLVQRGLTRLGEDPPAPEAETPDALEDAPDVSEEDAAEDEDTAAHPPTIAPEAPLDDVVVPFGEEEEDVDDPLSLSLDDLEPLVEQRKAEGPQPQPELDREDMDQRLEDALKRISACYEGTELPPAVDELRDLVEQRDYDALRSNITEVWNGLLGFHQKRGIRPHHQVTHAFNVIHGLVQSGVSA